MANQFPNKLITLRKHFNYSQQDIAEIMGVPVAEYMKWENGSKLCTISQLSKLADTFKVTLDELFDNSIEITLPVLELENSIEIPFQNALGKNIPNITTENIITDDIFETEEVNQTSSLDKTIVTRIITDNTLEVIEPEETMVLKKPKVTIEPKKESKPKTKDSKSVKNNKNLVILASVAGVALFMGGSGAECRDRCDLDGDIADGVCFEIFIDDLGVIRFFRTDDRVDCDTLLDV